MAKPNKDDPSSAIQRAAQAMGDGPLTEQKLITHIHPLFTRVLARRELYLANHSLGRPPDAMAESVTEGVAAWYSQMDEAWEPWLSEMERFRGAVADIVGCAQPSRVVPRASAGQGLRAVLTALRPRSPDGVLRVVTTTGEFDSLDFILRAWALRGELSLTLVPPDNQGLFHADTIAAAVDEHTDLVVVSQVVFSSGQVIEGLEDLVAHAHSHGARVLVDVYHAAGVLPLSFDRLGADFAIGGSYKYLRGGPGAAWLVLGNSVADDPTIKPLDTGWFGKQDTFAFSRAEVAYKPGGDGWQESTPAVLPLYQARAGMAFVRAIGVQRLRDYSLMQQQQLAEALQARGVPVRVIEPRGAFILVPDKDIHGLLARCKAAGMSADGRPAPDGNSYVRLCPDVLNTHDELLRAAEIVARCRAARGPN